MESADSKRQKIAEPSKDRACGLAALPSPALKFIFALACDQQDGRACVSGQLYPLKPVSPSQSIPHLMTVCKAWSQAIADIADEFSASTHTIRFRTAQRNELPGVLQAVAVKGDRIRDLRVWIGTANWLDDSGLEFSRSSIENAEQLTIDWQRIFSCCPQTVRLDLSLVPVNSKHLYQILDAASTHCRGLQYLMLPEYQDWNFTRQRLPDFPGIMRQLYQALERWHKYQEPSGGLRQLSVPKKERLRARSRSRYGYEDEVDSNFDSDSERESFESDDDSENFDVPSDDYLNQVATFCPNIEYLRGWKKVTLGNLYLDEDSVMTWFYTLNTWRNFCKTCAQLREFHWFMVPLDDALLEIFGEYPKLELKKMGFAWGSYFGDVRDFVSEELHRPRGDLKVTSNGIIKAIEACPALEELDFWMTPETRASHLLQNETDDNVLRAIANSCLHLKKLTICELTGKVLLWRMKGITDAGLIAISRLPKLEHIAIKQTKLTADGILALIQNIPNPQHKRRVILEIGCIEMNDTICFLKELVKFMELLSCLPANSLHGHRFELELQMKYFDKSQPPEQMQAKLSALKHQVVTQHSNVAIEFFSSRYPRRVKAPPKNLGDLQSVFFISPRRMARCSSKPFDASFD